MPLSADSTKLPYYPSPRVCLRSAGRGDRAVPASFAGAVAFAFLMRAEGAATIFPNFDCPAARGNAAHQSPVAEAIGLKEQAGRTLAAQRTNGAHLTPALSARGIHSHAVVVTAVVEQWQWRTRAERGADRHGKIARPPLIRGCESSPPLFVDRRGHHGSTDRSASSRAGVGRPSCAGHPSSLLVARPHLLDQLTAWLDRRLILVSAPAGYGKTALASQWLDSVDGAYAWLSLDEQDNDPATFLHYLVAAIRTVYHDSMGAIESVLLGRPHSLSPWPAGRCGAAGLAALPDPCILALDDYHSVKAPQIHELMARLVEHLPAHVHLVLITRADPPLPLERLRGHQQLGEIRADRPAFQRRGNKAVVAAGAGIGSHR